MNEKDIIDGILKQILSDEIKLIGNDNLELILNSNGEIEPMKLKGGQSFDLATTITIVSSAVGLIRQLILLYRTLSEKGTKPTPSELIENLPPKNRPRKIEVSSKLPVIANLVINNMDKKK